MSTVDPHFVDIPDVGTGTDPRPPREEQEPRATPPRDRERPERRRPRSRDARLMEDVTGLYEMVGGGLVAFGLARKNVPLAAAGVNIGESAEGVASAWLDLADRNPAVRAGLERFVAATSGGALLGYHVAMIAPLAAAFGLLNPMIADTMSGGKMANAQEQVLVAMGITREQYAAAAAQQGNGQG